MENPYCSCKPTRVRRTFYERDLEDSYTGGGAGLEWGPVPVNETPAGLYLLPMGLLPVAQVRVLPYSCNPTGESLLQLGLGFRV